MRFTSADSAWPSATNSVSRLSGGALGSGMLDLLADHPADGLLRHELDLDEALVVRRGLHGLLVGAGLEVAAQLERLLVAPAGEDQGAAHAGPLTPIIERAGATKNSPPPPSSWR